MCWLRRGRCLEGEQMVSMVWIWLAYVAALLCVAGFVFTPKMAWLQAATAFGLLGGLMNCARVLWALI